MNLQALEVFCEVARHHSFSRGAVASGISQSAASQLVAHLEKELGFKLIDRSRRPLTLTEEGEMYHHGCVEVLRQHRSLLEEIGRHRKAISGVVHVASIYSAGLHTVSRYGERFSERHPEAKVRLEYYAPSKVYSAVLRDEADLGIVSYPKPSRELEVLPWIEEEMVLVCAPSYPLAGSSGTRLRDLRDRNFVTFDPDLRIRQEIDRMLRKNRVRVRIASEFDNIETIKQALEIEKAVSILPRPSVERDVRRNTLVTVPLEDLQLKRPVGILHHRKATLSPTTKAFVQMLREEAPEA